MIHRNQIQGFSALVACTLLLLFLARLTHLASSPIVLWVLVWAGMESLMSFYGISWGLERSNRVFFSIFGGGFIVRLVSLGVLAYTSIQLSISPTLPLLSLAAAYFILSIVQLPFIVYGLH